MPIRFKIFEAGASDWQGLILGGRTLDTPAKGGLGLRVTDTHYVLESEGVILPRVEEDRMPRKDWVYMLSSARGRPSGSALGPPAVGAAVYAKSVVDSDGEESSTEAGGKAAAVTGVAEEGGDPLKYEGERIDLEPGEGAWVPVRRKRRQGPTQEHKAEVVLQGLGAPTDVAPGLWTTGQDEGLVFVANTTAFDQEVEPGATVGVVARAAVQTRVCGACGAEDTEAWPEDQASKACEACKGPKPGGRSSCRQCGAGPDKCKVLTYAGCKACEPEEAEKKK